MPWLPLLLNRTTLATVGLGVLVLLVGVQNWRLSQAQKAAASAVQRAEAAEATATQTSKALDIYKAEVAYNATRAIAAGKVRATTQAKVGSIMSSNRGEGAATKAKEAAPDIANLWNSEPDDDK